MEENIIEKYDVIFRPSSSFKDGAGHFSRCFAFSQNFSKKKLLFILDNEFQLFKKKLNKKKLEYKIFSKFNYLGIRSKICILDGYNFSENEKKHWRRNCDYLIVVDDFVRGHDYADLIINFGFESHIKKVKKVEVISDLKYALVEQKYFKVSKNYKINPKVENLFLSFGFLDSNGVLLKILKVLQKMKMAFNVNIVIGSKCPHLCKIKALLNKSSLNYNLLVDNENVENIMAKCDLAIGSGGVSLLERLIIGIPSITLLTSKNQINQTKKISNMNATMIRNFNDVESQIFISDFLNLVQSFELRKKIFLNCRNIINKNSGKNLVNVIKKKFKKKFKIEKKLF